MKNNHKHNRTSQTYYALRPFQRPFKMVKIFFPIIFLMLNRAILEVNYY